MTTAKDAVLVPWQRNRFLQALFVAWALVWIVAAIEPFDRFDWLLENMLVVVAAALLIWRGNRDALSDLAWLLIAVFMMLHAVGAHYTYAEAPPGFWIRDAFGLERNHFDRIVHFSFGFLLAYPLREYLARHVGGGRQLGELLSFALIATASALYEVLEWLVAAVVSPEAGMAYLGTQGDVFDAQKDTALAILGAAIMLLATRRRLSGR
jgi:putative membrane protein